MYKPAAEIAKVIEAEHNCKITIIKGGSGNLLKSIKLNEVGDLYLPGSSSYMETCIKEEIVSETVFVGFNKAVLMVQKGNPKKIAPELESLLNDELVVAVGNPKSGSIGR